VFLPCFQTHVIEYFCKLTNQFKPQLQWGDIAGSCSSSTLQVLWFWSFVGVPSAHSAVAALLSGRCPGRPLTHSCFPPFPVFCSLAVKTRYKINHSCSEGHCFFGFPFFIAIASAVILTPGVKNTETNAAGALLAGRCPGRPPHHSHTCFFGQTNRN
jgi:hypothetical protein